MPIRTLRIVDIRLVLHRDRTLACAARHRGLRTPPSVLVGFRTADAQWLEHGTALNAWQLSAGCVISAHLLCRSMVVCKRRPRRIFLVSPPDRRARS